MLLRQTGRAADVTGHRWRARVDGLPATRKRHNLYYVLRVREDAHEAGNGAVVVDEATKERDIAMGLWC